MQVNSRFFLKDMNKATTIDEQIKILQGRGMIITDIPKAKEVLQNRAIELKNKIIELLEKNKTLSKHIGALYELNNI